jgi:UDP-N-acetylmuramate dehydrogenase
MSLQAISKQAPNRLRNPGTLISELRGRVYFDEPLSKYTTFNIGGPARVFVKPLDEGDLKKILSFSRRFSMPYYILGNGSNLLISDIGVNGVVIKLNGTFNNFNFRKNLLTAGGGIALAALRSEALKKGLSGLEFTTGIPGTLGGAIAMNAGAGSSNIGGIVKRVQIMDKRGAVKWLSHKEIDFGYRSASFEKGSIILKAELKLSSDSPVSIKKRISSIWKKRKGSQPIKDKSAGSIFKNPHVNARQSSCQCDEPDSSSVIAKERLVLRSLGEGGSNPRGAGFLIEKAGLKGISCGRAYISPLHANFIINHGGATAKNVMKLIKIAQEKVSNKFGIRLELEIKIW